MFNRHSILFKLNIIFLFTLFSISVIFFAIHDFISKKSYMDLEFSLTGLERTLNLYSKGQEELNFKEYLSSFRLREISDDKKYILMHAKELEKNYLYEKGKPPPLFDAILKKFGAPLNFEHFGKNLKLLEFKNQIYLNLKSGETIYLLLYDDREAKEMLLYIKIIYILFISLVILIYVMIKKNLNGLKGLHKSLIEYENGIVDTTKIIEGKNEVALLSKQFYKVAQKLDTLSKTRKLFLRNMMHEIKTPLTKSKLYLSLIEESQMRDSLELSLQKLELLIEEMVNIEKISTDNMEVEKKEYRLIDIIENAMDTLFLSEEKLNLTSELNCTINADFKLFSIVLKNLIDNAIKYSKDSKVSIECRNEKVYVSSQGERLKYDFEAYLEPFFKGDLNEINQRGFGLGLYIVNEILIKHSFIFSYEYEANRNIFVINYSSLTK